MHTVLLLLGGNLGAVKERFNEVIATLRELGDIISSSSLYRSEAWGMGEAPDFLNQALVIRTPLKPEELLLQLKEIELSFGRQRKDSSAYESRTMDIDILLIDTLIIETPSLTVPHPRMHQRKFTMIPAAEIAGNWHHPVFNKKLASLAKDCEDTLKVEVL